MPQSGVLSSGREQCGKGRKEEGVEEFEIEIEKRGKSAVFLELEIILAYCYNQFQS